jgi:hypothetical protein
LLTCRIDLNGASVFIMRTPGRCSNIEGCWISASQRDVWLAVGEDFTCPNCGGALSAPPGRSMSMQAMKRAAVMGVTATMAVAAVAVVTVKISTLPWSGQTTVLAMTHAPGSPPAFPSQVQPAQRLAANPALVLTGSQGHATPLSQQRFASSAPAAPAAPAALQRPKTGAAPAPVLLYTAASDPAPSPASHNAMQTAASPKVAAPAQQAAAVEADVPAALVTLISQASFVLPPTAQRPVILPISFGRPVGPETDAAPVALHWRHHGLVRRQSYFLPAPGQD